MGFKEGFKERLKEGFQPFIPRLKPQSFQVCFKEGFNPFCHHLSVFVTLSRFDLTLSAKI